MHSKRSRITIAGLVAAGAVAVGALAGCGGASPEQAQAPAKQIQAPVAAQPPAPLVVQSANPGQTLTYILPVTLDSKGDPITLTPIQRVKATVRASTEIRYTQGLGASFEDILMLIEGGNERAARWNALSDAQRAKHGGGSVVGFNAWCTAQPGREGLDECAYTPDAQDGAIFGTDK